MLPFTVQFRSGQPVYEQVVFAVHKALASGQLRAGDAFPSVRQLSGELKINPNTAHKVVAQLKQEGILEVQPGRGTFISERRRIGEADATALLSEPAEALVVQARQLGIPLEVVVRTVEAQWNRL